MILCFTEGDPSQLRDRSGKFWWECWIGVDACAYGSSSLGQFTQAFQRRFYSGDTELDLASVATELLGKGQGHGIHQVSSAGLDHMGVFVSFGQKSVVQVLKRRNQLLTHL